jgi:hypothetical protein
MYRGSSFLLWKDFRIHRFAVRELLQPRYDPLLGLRPDSRRQSAEAVPRILALADAIRDTYCGHVGTINGRRVTVEVTDTLTTKIILGTLACIPAYDSYVIEGLRAAGISFSRLSERHLESLFEWYRE